MKSVKIKMKPGLIRSLIIALLSLTGVSAAQGQPGQLSFFVQIPEIALVDVEPTGNNNITLDLAAPTEAGMGMAPVSTVNNSLWLNYTCSKSTGSPARNVYVQVMGSIPSGVQIRLQASPLSAAGGAGIFGNPAATPVILSNDQKLLVSGIGGCYTGNGTGYGHQLVYTIDVTNFALLDLAGNSVIQVFYTIADH